MSEKPIQIAALLARGIDPATGQPMQDPPQRPERVDQRSSVRSGRKKKTVGETTPRKNTTKKKKPVPSKPNAFRFTIVEEPHAPPVHDDLDVLAIILPLDKYLARRHATPNSRLSGPNRYRRTALIALEQQWTIEYWRARALHFERLQGIKEALSEPPALRRR